MSAEPDVNRLNIQMEMREGMTENGSEVSVLAGIVRDAKLGQKPIGGCCTVSLWGGPQPAPDTIVWFLFQQCCAIG